MSRAAHPAVHGHQGVHVVAVLEEGGGQAVLACGRGGHTAQQVGGQGNRGVRATSAWWALHAAGYT